jgi:hypothetical protein
VNVIKLNCPNCNGKIEYKEGQIYKCLFCDTELLLKENNVYYVDQTINHYYGTAPSSGTARPGTNLRKLWIVPLMLIGLMAGYFFLNGNPAEQRGATTSTVRTMPESEVILFFLRDVFDKGDAMPTEEEIAKIRYLSVRHDDEDRWRFTYSLDDPFTNGQAELIDYAIHDKLLNTQRIEQKDFEAFSGLTELNLMNEYEVSQGTDVGFRHLQGIKAYAGGFNESFGRIANYFGDNSQIVKLSTQIRSNEELALLLKFPKLQSLEISYVNETVTDFHLLNQLPLQSLSLTTVDHLGWLSSLTGLKSLSVSYSKETDFSALYSLSQLQELKLSMVENLKTINFMQNMPNLQSLDLDYVPITNLERLRDKTSLTNLRLTSPHKLESVEAVNSLTSLTELSITGYHGAKSPISLPNLKKAELQSKLLLELTAPVLQSLTVDLFSEDLDGANLAKYPRLEQLSLKESGNFTGIPSLNRLTDLRTLHFNETYFFEETSALFQLQHVKAITCTECSFQFHDQESFANNTLEHLTLNQPSFRIGNGDWLNDAENVMHYFADMAALRSFTMQDDSIQTLDFMKDWERIEVLHLENNAISNVEPLAHLPHLQKVYLLGNQAQNKSVLDKGILIY